MQGEVVSLEKQVEQFELVCGNITEILGPEKAATFVSKALFLISIGSNDILDYTHGYSSVFQFGKEEHLAVLQHNYYLHIKVSTLISNFHLFTIYNAYHKTSINIVNLSNAK